MATLQPPAVPQRSASFNPEAATFSPSIAKAAMATAGTGQSRLTSPDPRLLDVLGGESLAAHISNEQEAKPAYPQPAYHHQAMSHTPREVQQDTASRATLRRGTMDSSMTFPSLGSFSPASHEHNFSTPAVGELSASLGLPDIERRSTTNDPSAQSHGYRASEAKPNFVPGLDGGLIGRALSKPMTANYLAQYLSGLNVQQGQGTPPQGSQGSQDSPSTPLQEGKAAEEQATKIVQPPPGFDSTRARKIRAVESSAAAVSATARAVKDRPRVVPTGPFAMRRARGPSDLAMHCSPSPSNTSQSLEQLGHARNISGGQRHRPRAYTRTKRTDQGPEPSAADIYPDDANYTPRRPSNPLEPAGPFPFPKLDQTPQSHFSTGDRVSWPTPVEVYTLKPQKPQTPRSLIQLFEQQYGDQAYIVAPPPVPFDIFADHSYPSQTDLESADGEVTALLSSIPTLFRQQEDQIQAQDQDIVELSCDTRSLTPQQLTGARYGLRHFGIGLGDTWICPEVKDGEPFRVRPRNHDGWGSWEWAIRKGWGEE